MGAGAAEDAWNTRAKTSLNLETSQGCQNGVFIDKGPRGGSTSSDRGMCPSNAAPAAANTSASLAVARTDAVEALILDAFAE